MLTDPTQFPEKGGIDERDQNHPNFPRKVVKVFMKPAVQKIVERNLWFETVMILMVFFTGCAELIGRQLSVFWYIVLLCVLFASAYKTHRRLTQMQKDLSAPSKVVEEEDLK
jgi:uncharacterized membrane protein (UPF0182 family)